MKKFILTAFLLVSSLAFSQGIRYDIGSPGSAGVVTTSGSGLPYLIALPGVTLNWCNYPANAAPCTNFASTYSSLALTTPCPTNQPIVLQGSSSCQGTSDNAGNLGVYTIAGTYSYTLTYGATTFGPFTVSVGGTGGGGGGGAVLETNGTPNALQSLLNLVQGTGISLTNVGGAVNIVNTGVLGATSNGGLVQSGFTLGLRLDCSVNQVPTWSGTAWLCGTAGTGTVTGSGTPGIFPVWSGPSTIGNSALQSVTSPNGLQYTTGTGQYFQIDSGQLSWNTGVSGSGNILIQNTFSPGAGNNAGGIKIIAAPTTGNACAGSAWLIGGSGGFPAGLATIDAEGACNDGFGAGAASLDLTAGTTAANNTGGNINLTPGTGGFGNGQVVITRGGLVTQGTAASSFGGAVTVSGNLTVVGTCTGCSTYPTGTGIPQVSGGSSWGSTLSETGSGNVVLSNNPVLVTPNLGTPSTLVLTNATGAPTWNQNTTGTAANLTGCTPSTAGSVCIWNGSAWTLFAGNTSGTASLQENASGVPTWGSGSATTFQVNGTGLISATTVNFLNSAATDGITLTFTNGSAGQVTLGFTGTLTNAGLANPATTVNSQTCTLGSTCTIPFQTNTVNNTSQAGINLKPSTVNAVGLTATPTNTGTNVDTFEITGGSYSGNAAGLYGTPSITVNALTATTYNGGTWTGTWPGSPTISGNPTFSGSPVFNMTGGPFCVQETAGVLSSTGVACGSGGGGSISGTQNYVAYFATTSTLGSVGSAISGQTVVFQSGAPPIASSPSLVDSTTSPVVTTPYTVQCDSSSTIIDRAHIVRLGTGSSVVTVPLSSGLGCSGLVTTLRNDSATAVTVNKTSTDTFTIFNGSANLDSQTTFQLASGHTVTISQSQTGIWEVAIAEGGTIYSLTAGSGLSGGTITTTGTIAIAAGGVTNGMLAGSIALSNLATQSGNTVVANFTGSTAAPVAYAMASCSGNNDAEIYTTSTGLGCGTNFGQLNVASTWTTNQTLTGHLVISSHDLTIPLACADTSGSGTVQVCNTSPTFVPAAGDRIAYTTTTANTGTGLTVNVNSLGAKSVAKWQNSTTIAANDVRANTQVILSYDGTNWELDTIGNSPAGTGTVTHSLGALTSTAFMTGNGSADSQTPSATSTLSSGGNAVFAGTITATLGTLSGNGAASTSGLILTGSAYTAGSATTNFPQLYLNSGASGPTTFSANGTQFGINPVSGFAGNDIDLHVPNGGASVWTVNYQGLTTIVPSASVGGAVNYLKILSPAAEATTGWLLNVDTTAGSGGAEPNSFRVGSDGFAQMQVCTLGVGGAAAGVDVFGSAIACSALAASPLHKNIFTSANAAHDLITAVQTSTAATGNMIELSNATAAGTGFNFEAYYSAVTGTDGSHSGGTLEWSVNGQGDASGRTFTATTNIVINGGTALTTTNQTGTGNLVLATNATLANPTMTTPTLGAATATSLLATGIIDGTAPITVTSGTTANLGTTYKSGYTFNQEATAGTGVTYTLPATALGLQYCVRNSIVSGTGAADTGVLTVYPAASSYVILNGVRNTIGGGGTHGVASGGAAGDSACFVAVDATDWEIFVIRGTWTAN